MTKLNTKSKKGFTIIEVVLVLAIAGLIFLMVFVALPALQRSQRDTQRRDDLARVATAVTQYQTNNGGKLPSADKSSNLINNYLGGDEFVDPDGAKYDIEIIDGSTGHTYDSKGAYQAGTLTFGDHKIYLIHRALCNGETSTQTGAQARSYAILYKLEGTGTYCADNQ